jgi:hypothetical protein
MPYGGRCSGGKRPGGRCPRLGDVRGQMSGGGECPDTRCSDLCQQGRVGGVQEMIKQFHRCHGIVFKWHILLS